jgi:hypothetical protein
MRTVTLYRASDDDDVSQGTSFAEDVDAARAYLDNPGFGGSTLWQCQVVVDDDKVLDLRDESVADVARSVGMSDPGAITVDAWLPRTQQALDALSLVADWALVDESFPEGTTTWILLGGEEPEMTEMEE